MGILGKLTEEEQFLKKQYKILNDLKQELKKLRLEKKKEESATADANSSSANQSKKGSKGSAVPVTSKKDFQYLGKHKASVKPTITSAEAAANTEAAKKLLKSGAIQLKSETKTSFKRSSNLKRRLNEPKTKKPIFQNLNIESESTDNVSDRPSGLRSPQQSRSPKKSLQHSPSYDDDDSDSDEPTVKKVKPTNKSSNTKSRMSWKDKKDQKVKQAPTKGNTIYLYGHCLTETLIRQYFEKFGRIYEINFQKNKSAHFVTYDTYEAAEEAIKDMNDQLIDDCRIKVSLARHQPLRRIVLGQTNKPWNNLSEMDRGDKGSSVPDSRSLVAYDDDPFADDEELED